MSETPQSTPPEPAPLLAWEEVDGGAAVAVRPWLTDDDARIVRALFKDTLKFDRTDGEAGTATTIAPRIAAKDQPTVERALAEYWAAIGIDPARRPKHLPQPAPPKAGETKAAGYTWSQAPTRREPPEPTIVFSPAAFHKYLYMANAMGGHTEVGGYGVHRLLGEHGTVIYVDEFVTVRQAVTPAFCSLDPDAANEAVVARCVADDAFNPNRFLACWCHTHPGFSVTPSSIDWATFADHDSADWAGMIICDRKGNLGAHVRWRTAFGSRIKEVKVSVDWEGTALGAGGLDPAAWAAEYEANIWPSAKRFHPDHRVAIGADDPLPLTGDDVEARALAAAWLASLHRQYGEVEDVRPGRLPMPSEFREDYGDTAGGVRLRLDRDPMPDACYDCGDPIEAGQVRCESCAYYNSLDDPACPECDEEVAEDAQFCSSCGADLEAGRREAEKQRRRAIEADEQSLITADNGNEVTILPGLLQ
jgi:hypothetical protein